MKTNKENTHYKLSMTHHYNYHIKEKNCINGLSSGRHA